MHTTADRKAPARPAGSAGPDATALRRSAAGAGPAGAAAPIVHDVLRSPGTPLDTATRAFFEPRFGHDFGRVRIHADRSAAESARAVRADAYTVGPHVVFGDGRPAPATAAARSLLAHELTHVVQQAPASPAAGARLTVASPDDAREREAERVSRAVASGAPAPAVSLRASPAVVARQPAGPRQATEEEQRETVDAAARWLAGMADQVEALRRVAAGARATAGGPAAGGRAFHRHLNQEVLGRLLNNAITVFERNRSYNPYVDFPAESPEQTRLGEANARAMEQFGLAIEEARANAANLAPADRETEERGYERNHMRWLESNPSSPLAAGIRTTFTQTEVDLSARRHAQVSREVADIVANLHQQNLVGDRAERLRRILLDAAYRLVRDPATGDARVQQDAALQATIQPVLDQLSGIAWAIAQAVDRLQRAEARTRAFAADPAGNQATGDTLQAHFSTRDPGYATLIADRLARMARELRGEGALTVHARDPQDPACTVGSIGGGFSITEAHAGPNRFHFCGTVTIGNERTVSTVVHETVHAVIPALGARGAITPGSDTPEDRAYAGERIYSRLSTEEALDNAESYSFYVDSLLGVQVYRPSAPRDEVTGCADAGPVHDAIARATYRIRLGAMWAEQTTGRLRGAAPTQDVIDVVQRGFPGADAARAQAVLAHLRVLASGLGYGLSVACRPATDREARAGALVYGPSHRATAAGVAATSMTYPGGTLRVCPAWFPADVAAREDSLTSILVLRYRSAIPAADVGGFVALLRFIQESAMPVPVRTLQEHQAADAAVAPGP